MSSVARLVVPFDGGSGTPGTSNGALCVAQILDDLSLDYRLIRREEGLSCHHETYAWCKEAALEQHVPVIYGGDHSLVFSAIKGVYEVVGPLTIVHFDAHHDRYAVNSLNHYSSFWHAGRLFDIDIVEVGHRLDCAPKAASLTRRLEGRVYVSFDVDYFAPDLVRHVHDPVACHPAEGFCCDEESLQESLTFLESAEIVGMDICEWKGAERATPEHQVIKRTIERLEGLL